MSEVTLVALSEAHLEATLEWLSDPDLRRRIDSIGEPTPDSHERYWRSRMSDGDRPAFAILSDGVHVGNCGLAFDRVRRKCEAWMYLGAGRGTGVGRAALAVLLRSAFEGAGMHRVFVRVLATNEDALGFWRSAGFVEEGRLRADTWSDAGPVDAFVLAMLEPEWRGLTSP